MTSRRPETSPQTMVPPGQQSDQHHTTSIPVAGPPISDQLAPVSRTRSSGRKTPRFGFLTGLLSVTMLGAVAIFGFHAASQQGDAASLSDTKHYSNTFEQSSQKDLEKNLSQGKGTLSPAGGVFSSGQPLVGMIHTVKFLYEEGIGIDGTAYGVEAFEYLDDPGAWRSAANVSFTPLGDSEISGGATADLTFALVSPSFAQKICARTNTPGQGVCFTGDMVVISAQSWALGAKTYQGNLGEFRRYLINHGTGLAFGQPVRDCAAAGAPAPIMMPQAATLGKCRANPWPIPKAS